MVETKKDGKYGLFNYTTKNEIEAKEMLKSLSGKIHQVYTGITIKTLDKIITETDVADVEFDEISDEEIDFYIKKYQPFDKAGAYGIQEWIGFIGVSKIEGSYANVMGMPTDKVFNFLLNLNKK